MREILVLSGKGGTGKTTLTAALANLAAAPVICDLDVDAPDMHLLLQPVRESVTAFISGHDAVIRPEVCERCGTCRAACQFDAIQGDDPPRVNPLKCEGCKLCVALCPAEAIDFTSNRCGNWYRSSTRFGPMAHAQLFPAEENSGRLVTLLRREARTLAAERGRELMLADGPPGIGCPVIAALSGVDLVVIVTEPTVSGRHDLERVLELCRHFNVAAGVVINKCDLNREQADGIEAYCREHRLALLGKLPHTRAFTVAMVKGLTIAEHDPDGLGNTVRDIWQRIEQQAVPQPASKAAVDG
ncbi:MAG: ATP-binding protein [Desulfobacterales bacterium]|nr:ATP-binding protein [Desulfobacterales bacterium]